MKKEEQDKPKNSSMTKDLEEMKEHGKVMEHLDTNKELKKKGLEPDPKQTNKKVTNLDE